MKKRGRAVALVVAGALALAVASFVIARPNTVVTTADVVAFQDAATSVAVS